MTEPMLFPIGHYGGRHFPGNDGSGSIHRVRVGRRNLTLADGTEFMVWMRSHGGADDAQVTRSDVLADARDRGVPDPEGTIDALVNAGLLVDVPPDGLVEFGKAHRLVPLLVGLGNTREELVAFRIGVAGFDPVLTVDRIGAEMWQFAGDCESLWAACELLAAVARDTGDTAAIHTDPAELLAAGMPALRALLRRHAAHLDVSVN